MKFVSISALQTPRLLRALLAATAASVLAPFASAAVTWHDVQFGGFASQGYLVNTGHNDYLGDTSDGTFNFREYAANASYSFGKFRVGAQVFGQKLGQYGEDKIKLDWALVDYQATQWFGIRAGRVKMPRGLYNEALDLDSLRPFVLLPQSVYDARLRDFNAAFNGAMIYGNVSLKRFGSLDYRAFYGKIPMSIESGASDYFNTGFPAENLAIGMNHTRGGSIFWNTPIPGLRAGYSYSEFDELQGTRRGMIGATLITYTKTADAYKRHLVSVEYTHGEWIFAAEAGREQTNFRFDGMSATPLFGPGKIQYAYVSASRRINSWLELGTYYSFSQDKQRTNPLLRQNDFALSTKFDLSEHLIFKLEAHYMDGAGKIFDIGSHPQPLAKRNNEWTMLAAKMTYSF